MMPKEWLKQLEEKSEFTWVDSVIMYDTLVALYGLAVEMANEEDPHGSHYALRIIETMVENINSPIGIQGIDETRKEKED